MLKRLVRAFRLRCPRCGGGPVVKSWFTMHERCPACGLRLDRGESGYQVGSYMVAMIMIELIFASMLVGILLATWPTPPWRLLQWGGVALMLLGPVVLFPLTKTLYLAFDLTFRPERD
jgi:uncharacterized protein (DUF983 family)